MDIAIPETLKWVIYAVGIFAIGAIAIFIKEFMVGIVRYWINKKWIKKINGNGDRILLDFPTIKQLRDNGVLLEKILHAIEKQNGSLRLVDKIYKKICGQ